METSSRLRASVPPDLQEPWRTAVEAASEAWCELLGQSLVSLVLFGSVARRQAREGSDIDALVIASGFPWSLRERRAPLLAAWERARAERELPWVQWSIVPKSIEEGRSHSPLYLDLVEDGILLVDRDRFFESVLDAMRERMRVLGSRRLFLPDGSWYWDLKPDFRWGDVVEI